MTQKRLLCIYTALVLAFFALLCRLYWLGTDTAYATSALAQADRQAVLPRQRGNFYDRDNLPLTGTDEQWYALCIPGDSSYTRLFPYVSYEAQTEIYRLRNSESLFLTAVSRNLTAEGIYTYAGRQRYLPLPIAAHTIGYLDSEGHGISGLERAYDDILYAAGDTEAVECITNAQGALMQGQAPMLTRLQKGTDLGIKLTLDAYIQRACEGIAALNMQRGCIIVMERETGRLLALVSLPEFDPNDIAPSIAADDTSLINRPLAAFDAGSVFKVVLAVAAYEAGLAWYSYDCAGQITVGDQSFRCALGRAHGQLNLRGALQQSCNCYFIALGQQLGYKRILAAARELGFGMAAALAPGLKSATGTLPDEETLQNSEGQQAIFSFGQGQLTVTPLQITAMMNTIANEGVYCPPMLVDSVINQSDMTPAATPETAESQKVCAAWVAEIIKDMLVSVIDEGIAGEAKPGEGAAGGKTGTAQTGRYDAEGNELLNYWFSGFYPADNPQYTITVLQDGVYEPENSSAAIFSAVANAIYLLEK